jgi:hypothetical protein
MMSAHRVTAAARSQQLRTDYGLNSTDATLM